MNGRVGAADSACTVSAVAASKCRFSAVVGCDG